MRRVFSAGGFAAIISRGSPEAGAVHIIARNRLGELALYAPAPQTSYDSAKPDDRFFTQARDMTEEEIEARLGKERRFDPDIWVVEVEIAGDIAQLISLKD